jgi:hypothetical protein
MESPFLVLAEVVRLLEREGVTYVLVGSLASSMHGVYRSTTDIDFLADIKPHQVLPLLQALESKFDIDEQDVSRAVEDQGSFNAIHLDSVIKVDIFIPKTDAFAHQQLERRQLRPISPDLNEQVYVATAEDTVLAKLRWYRAGGEVSTNQWADVIGVLGASGKDLDMEYLREWADKLDVKDLLERALTEAG